MTPKQVAKYLGLHIITLYRLIKKGRLPSFKVGGQWRIKKDLLDSWIKQQSEKNRKEE
ncbi:MAG: helix-turn-helix domain-containing protein [Candidatus Omnitrophica bacterium]|nr:helix-turn-helix domain-containing protein [Candidatus Omnitrophota bacterium]